MKALSNVQLTRAYVNQLKAALTSEERAEKAERLALAMSSRFDEKDYAALPDEYRLHIIALLNAKYD